MNEVNHIFAHRRAADAINEPSVLEPGVLGLHLLHHLFAERADLRRTRYRHVLIALIPGKSKNRNFKTLESNLSEAIWRNQTIHHNMKMRTVFDDAVS